MVRLARAVVKYIIAKDNVKRQRLQLRLAIRKLKRWGDEPAEAGFDIAPLRECYQYTVGEGNEDNYLLN